MTESKSLTTELKRNKENYGNGDIFTQRNIDLVNQYIASMEAYTAKDIRKVILIIKKDRGVIFKFTFLRLAKN